jgi:hypothetical protein
MDRILMIMGGLLVILLFLLAEAVILSFAWSQLAVSTSLGLPEFGIIHAFWGLIVVKIIGNALFKPGRAKVLKLSDFK